MDAVLVKLLLVRFLGGVRQRLNELKTLRGLLFLLVTIAVIALLLKQLSLPDNLLNNVFLVDAEQLREQMAQFMPTGLLAAFLLMAFIAPSPALYFSPTEINLLFSGPFTRRALLMYKLSFFAFGAFLSSLLIMLMGPAFTYSRLAAFSGAFLTMLFIQLLTVASGLLFQLLVGHFYLRRGRVGYAIITLIALIAATVWNYAGDSGGLTGVLARFQSSLAGTLILAPFNVFARIFLAQAVFPDLVVWSALGLAMILGLIAVVVLLDRHSGESSIAASLKLHKRWVRARRSGLPWGGQPLIVRSVLPPPLLGGIGPVAWRQMLFAFRSAGRALWMFLGVAAFAGPLLVIASRDISKWSLMGGVFFAAVFVLPRTLVFDFRSDLDAMENFKALPLSPWKISIGQLASPVLLTCLIELVLVASAATMLDSESRVSLIGLSPFLVPFNLLLYGIENLFFLLFPAPLVPVGRVDFDFLGRTMVGFSVTTTILLGGCLLAAGVGQLTVTALAWSWPVFLTTAWFSLAMFALMTLPLLSWAFKRFDVSR